MQTTHHLHDPVGMLLLQCLPIRNQLRFQKVPEDNEQNPGRPGRDGMQYRRRPSSWKDPEGTQPEAGSNAEATLISWRDPGCRQMSTESSSWAIL